MAYDINDRGQVVGTSLAADGSQHVVLWSDGVIYDLNPAGAVCCSALRLNNAGHVILGSYDAQGFERALLWRDGVLTDLGTLGGTSTNAFAINDRDQVVGGSNRHAFLWEDGTMHDLGWLGRTTTAHSINNRGQVVGTGNNIRLHRRGFIWEDGQMTDLGALPGDNESFGVQINEAGEIAGQSSRLSCCVDTWHPVVWRRGVLSPLSPTFATDQDREVVAINPRGLIVGFGRGGPWVWDDGVTWELPTLGVGGKPAAVNARGDIVGSASLSQTLGGFHAVLWRRTNPTATALPSP